MLRRALWLLLPVLVLAGYDVAAAQSISLPTDPDSVGRFSAGIVASGRPEASARFELDSRPPALTFRALDKGGMPRWVKWGLIGAAGGAVAFAFVGRLAIDEQPNPVLQDAALGAVAGFVIIGGSVALYDAVCGGDSEARRAGLC